MIIADTNVVSEFMRDSPDPAVLTWARALAPRELSICVVTVEEIERGLELLPAGRRRRDLEQRWTRLVDAFADTIAVYDVPAARTTVSILVAAESVDDRWHWPTPRSPGSAYPKADNSPPATNATSQPLPN